MTKIICARNVQTMCIIKLKHSSHILGAGSGPLALELQFLVLDCGFWVLDIES